MSPVKDTGTCGDNVLKTPIGTYLAVLDLGGRLDPAEGGRLRAMLPPNCPTELHEAIRAHKAVLRVLSASPNFVVVRSDVLPPSLLIWTATDQDRDLLIACGAPRNIVYTRHELAAIAQANPDTKSLMLLSECKHLFGGRLVATQPCDG